MMRYLWVSLFVWACSLAQAVELISEPQVKIADQTVTLLWKTDVACGTRVRYGLAEEKLEMKVEGGVTDNHEIELRDLKADTTYHYSLGSARQTLHTGSFKVLGKSEATAPEISSTPERKSILAKVMGIFNSEEKPATVEPASKAQPRAPPTRETWGRMETLRDHFDRHGADFQCRDSDDYAAQAWFLLQRGKAGQLPMKWDDTDGTLRVFDPQTRAFAAYNRDGTTKTFFRPNNASYWQRQPGRPIKSTNLPF
ncbi:MAG: hypothetical protein OJI67_15415 [Prosthecobacter sp.]|nr:hypothetical protein [Prosthecobacter sp.]